MKKPQSFRGPKPKSDRFERPERRPPPRMEEEPVFGLRAGLAVISKRPADVVRVLFAPPLRRDIEEMCRAAERRHIERVETEEERITRFSGSTHHEGLCVMTAPRKFASLGELGNALVEKKGSAIALDRVRNPYNIGAMLRSAAFFGIDAAILGAPAPHPALPPDAVRVAEGGVEHLQLARTTDLAETLSRLRARGVHVFGAESDGAEDAFTAPLPRPLVLVVGHEREGLGDRIRAQCDGLLAIPGTGAVGSLNVGIAASIMMAEVIRRH